MSVPVQPFYDALALQHYGDTFYASAPTPERYNGWGNYVRIQRIISSLPTTAKSVYEFGVGDGRPLSWHGSFIVFRVSMLPWRSDPFQQHLPGGVILAEPPDKEFQMWQTRPRHRMRAEVKGQTFGVKPRGQMLAILDGGDDKRKIRERGGPRFPDVCHASKRDRVEEPHGHP